ncbi:hypothetical protein PYW07_001450 [Mythimna separata]|uniref:EGF-like domain-containing protein n=1 Tax=Mythimna separata TaxID=271217 RepID=A0AAD7YSI5_MYTSE|nr:hypothetical protein PYW07_001450 [Mythimna separata]
MFLKWPVTYFCVIVYFFNELDAKYCERIGAVTSMVVETFSISYITAHQGDCVDNMDSICIKTRWTTALRQRYVPKRQWKTVKYCCLGYLRMDDSANDSDIVCEPICMPACKNGYCNAPGACACNAGYFPDPGDTHTCLPSCERGCEHGTCVAPDTCSCDFGYTLVNTTCQPVCTEPCHNGTCVAPETCECLGGYRKSEKNLCEPYCSNGCDHGFCAAPETCHCDFGWHIGEGKDDQNKRCEPICSEPCHNGICVAPETCLCQGAYKKSKSGTCEPVCTPPCGNATCIAPQTCSCLPGYHVGADHIYSLFDSPHLTGCSPTCEDCEHGHCIAPNNCFKLGVILSTEQKLPKQTFQVDDYEYEYYQEMDYDSHIENKKTAPSTVLLNADDTKTGSINDTDTIEYFYGTSLDDINEEVIKHSNSDKTKTTESMKSPYNESTEDAPKQSMLWIEHHWVSIFIPVLVIVTAAIIMLLVWRWAPIIIFFKGRSYVVEGENVDIDVSRPFEDIQISAINEKEKATEK